jgi:uncharacterized membrane protein
LSLTDQDPGSSLEAVRLLARRLGRALDEASLEDLFLCSPSYPSLLSISDGLRTIGIEHEAVEVDPADLDALDTPCLVRLRDSSLAVATQIMPDTVTLAWSAARREVLPRADFLARWSGMALAPTEVRPSRYRPPEAPSSARPWRPGIAATIVLAAAAAVTWWATPRPVELGILGALGTLGLLLSALLVAEELGYRTPATRLCAATRITSCRAVLSSPAARLGPISMADLGLGVFAGMVLAVIIVPASTGGDHLVVAALRGVSLAAIPYTMFSLVYQALEIRRWCPLCVLVQLVLWAIAAASWGGAAPLPEVGAPAWGMLVLGILPGLAWLAVKPALLRARELVPIRRALERTARDPRLVRALLEGVEPTPPGAMPLEITVGAPRPVHTITAYTNPTCPHCQVRQRELTQVLEHAGAHVRVVLRIVGPTWAEPSALALIATVAEALAEDRHERAFELMDLWARGHLEPASLRRPGSLTGEARRRYEAHHASMRRGLPVASIPAIFVDGRAWPAELSICGVGYLARETAALEHVEEEPR